MGPVTRQFVDGLIIVAPAPIVELVYGLCETLVVFARRLTYAVGDLTGCYRHN